MVKKILAIVAALSLPTMAFAQLGSYNPSVNGGVGGLINWVTTLLTYLFPLILALSVIWIVWYIFRYAVAGGEDEKSKAKTHIIWGIVGLFIMVSIWGLVSILTRTFQLNGTGPIGPTISPFPTAQPCTPVAPSTTC